MTINKKEQARLAGLAELAENDAALPAEGESVSGAAAMAFGLDLFAQAAGGQAALDTAIRSGRPRLDRTGSRGTRAKAAQVRLNALQWDALSEVVSVTGRQQSELLREAVDLLLDRYQGTTVQVRTTTIPVEDLRMLREQLHQATDVLDHLTGALAS